MTSYLRAPVVRIYDRGDRTVIFSPRGVHALDGDSAVLCRVVLDQLASRRTTREELLQHLASMSGAEVEHPEVIDQLLALLLDAGAVTTADRRPEPRAAKPLRIVVGITGAIAASHSPALILALLARGHDVRVVMTTAARRFVPAQALEAITHHRIAHDLWDGTPDDPVPHLELAGWADLVLVHPASATTISRLASGDFSELVSAVALSARGRVVLAPSMNPVMRSAPSVSRNLAQLTADGFAVLHAALGVEVAEAPRGRIPVLGPSPPHAVIVEAIEHLGVPRASWDDRWREPGPFPWMADALEPELASRITQRAISGARALDLGTGDGLVAEALAKAGLQVIATDVSPRALERARARGDATLPIVWLEDDARHTKLASTFALITDRGCLHVLEPRELGAWARTVQKLCAPGGHVLVVVHAPDAPKDLGTSRHDPAHICAALGPDFSLESVIHTKLGTAPARLADLKRALAV